MFFKKRREEAKAKEEAARQTLLKTFDDKHEQALQPRDPAERILKLEDQKQAIDAFLDVAQGKIVSEAKSKWMLGYLGGTLGSNLAFDAISILLIGIPTSFLMIIPSIIIGYMSGAKRVDKMQQRLQKENEPLFAALRERQDKADQAIDKIAEGDMRDFAESPKFQELLQRVPRLRDKFADAYKRHIIEGGLSGDKPEPKKKPPGFNV